MAGIVLQGKAIKICNKGGGMKCKTVNLGGGRRQTILGNKEKGTDYIVFKCSGCGQRNKRSAYDCKGRAGNSLSFKCHRCYREIEVAHPPVNKGLILDPRSPSVRMGLLGPDGKAL